MKRKKTNRQERQLKQRKAEKTETVLKSEKIKKRKMYYEYGHRSTGLVTAPFNKNIVTNSEGNYET